MFYSHEVLTSRKYGVATVWLVATLGSKSGLKKVSRKAILDVDVQRACETIGTPEAPMALRLQSNLLYGVSRVYAQQCGYVLTDVETAKNSMRTMLKVMKASALDEQGHKGRDDQLVLQDDPNFLPDFDLAPIDLERIQFDMTTNEASQRSTLSPRASQHTSIGAGDSQHDIGRLIIPQSASSSMGGPAGGFSALSARGSGGTGFPVQDGGLFDDDLGLIVGDNGVLLDDMPVRQPSAFLNRRDPKSPTAGNSQPQHDARADQEKLDQEVFDRPDDDAFMPLQDDYMFVSEPQVVPSQHEEQPQVIETSEETASASVRQRARPASKVIPLDTTMELHNGDLARWGTQYLANMEEALRPKNAAKAAAQAKKNAEFWMLGQSDVGPLSLFQGAQFLEAVTGINIGSGNKRVRDEGYETDETRRVRPRVGDLSSDELARGMEFDDGFMPMFGDDTIEQGRDVPTPLDEGHLSSMMPWNQSAGSRRPTALFSGAGQAQPTSASFGGAGLQLTLPARRGSRLTTESPLQGRSVPMPLGDQGDFQFPDSQADVGMTDAEEYELYGPAANVDTQTAAQSQWQRAALDGESVNFLGFVKAGIEELDIAREGASPGNEEDETLQGSIDFDGLLPPRSNTCIVAAQALLHVLSLGTKNLLRVEQEEAFGTVTLRPIVQI